MLLVLKVFHDLSLNNDSKVCLPRESMQGDVASGTISSQFAKEEPTSQLLVNMATDGLIKSLVNFRNFPQIVRSTPTSSISTVKEAVRTN
jgi:hypothetical protein